MRKLIILDGLSGSGKSTIEDMYRKQNRYFDYTLHRFTPSKWVYGKLYNRYQDYQYASIFDDEVAIQRLFPTYYIYLRCDNRVALRRKLDQRDENLEDLYETYKLFEEYHKVTKYKNKFMVDTSTDTPSFCLRLITEFINDSKNI